MNPLLIEMVKAWKRADHFCNGLPTEGFTALGRNQPAAIATNYSMMLFDHQWYEDGDIACDLGTLGMWARAINNYIDNHRVMDDDELKWCLASWRSRMLFNPVILTR